MGRGTGEKASAEGLLYGSRRRGPGPRLFSDFDDLIRDLTHNTIPDQLLVDQAGLMINSPAQSTVLAGEDATTLTLTGFHRPYQESELRLTLSAGAENNIALDWIGPGAGTVAEVGLLKGMADYLPKTKATVFFAPTSDLDVSTYLHRYFPDGGNYPLGLVVDPEDRRATPASELDYLAAESVEVKYFSDLVAASDLTDFMRRAQQPLLTLQQAFSARAFSFTLPLARFNDF